MKDLKTSEMMECGRRCGPRTAAAGRPWNPSMARFHTVDDRGDRRGDAAIMAGQNVRHTFVGEMGDVLMCYFDVPLRYGVAAYCEKHDGNMGGDYGNEYSRL